MKKALFVFVSLFITTLVSAQKTVYIPPEFSTDPYLSTWSYSRSYQSANFVVFWGSVVGTNPATYSDPNLAFNPQAVCDTLEKIYIKFITDIGFCSDAATKNLGKYKLIIVMNDTWGTGGPSGWAFGGTYGNTIGAMWVHPNATRDGGVTSHELTHSLQGMIAIQENANCGFNDYEPAGFFWETHANFMRTQMYPRFASDDLPRWMATSMFHFSSTRHHYDAFKMLWYMQQTDGITMVNRLWKESIRTSSTAGEHPLMTYRRLKSWTQSQLNNFMYDYVKREVACDYTVNNFGAIYKAERDRLKVQEPHYIWRLYTNLQQISATTGRYKIDNASAPQDYGYNIIPLYTTCSARNVTVKFKGHTEVNTTAGWRYGFVATLANGNISRYGATATANEGEISFTMNSNETQLYLVVMGAPTTHTTYVWEPGWPKIKRYPYELRIANAVPEGYQSTYRAAYKTNGHTHTNGGGWVANSATVASTAYVGPKAIVLGNSVITGTAQITGNAWVENATVGNTVTISGNASVYGGSYTGSAVITENAVLTNCTVSGSANVKGDALEWGVTFGNGVVVGGDAEIGSCATNGTYLQVPHPNNGRADCDGQPAGHTSNIDVNSSWSQFTDAQMAWSSTPTCSGTITPAAVDTTALATTVLKTGTGDADIRIYPNPVNNQFTITLQGFRSNTNVQVVIYNNQGAPVHLRDLQKARTATLRAKDWSTSPGVYYLRASGSNQTATRKLIITE
ncbi:MULTISPECIES: DUF6055 domain-containing protein [unclassified Chitinophaga]|uniref:DUF6055 domain-containing protein n=1 Tax=unclassified Chitinophaga TaxID=2619133 RepID=UPI00301006B8